MGGICDIRSESIEDREVDFTKNGKIKKNQNNDMQEHESIKGLKSTYNKHENNTIKEENDEQSNMDVAYHEKHITFNNKETERQKEKQSDEMNNENDEAAVQFKNDAVYNNIATDEVVCVEQDENNKKNESEEEYEVKVNKRTDNLTVNKAKPEAYSISHGLSKELQKYKL